MAAPTALAELPLEYLESKFASDNEDEAQPAAAPAVAEDASARPAAVDAGEQQQPGEEGWDEEEEWSDSDDDELADALEWADSRDGAH
jgi:hypothetical protein